MPNKPLVLVTDGDERAALAVTRALGKQGIGVIVGAETKRSLAAASRYCTTAVAYPSPYRQPDDFAESLRGIVEAQRVDAVFPISDIAMHVMGPKKNEFMRHTLLPVPNYDVYEAVSDKYRLTKLAMEMDVAVPQTIFVSDGNLERTLGEVKEYPVVVKPACSLIKEDHRWRKTAVQYAHSEQELRDLYRRHAYLQRASLIQNRVSGEGRGIFALMKDGVPLAMFAHRRIREKPPSGGVSVLRESISLDKTLVEPAMRLLQHVRWHGVAMVEFKMDCLTKRPVLMEINGRFWGSLQLAIDAGINFPWMLFQMAVGEPVGLWDNQYQIGVKSRWLLGDMDHLLMRLIKPTESLNLPARSSSRWRCILDFLSSFHPDTYNEIERISDWRPAMREWARYVGGFI